MAKTAPKAETLTAVEIALRLLEIVQVLLESVSDRLADRKKGGK